MAGVRGICKREWDKEEWMLVISPKLSALIAATATTTDTLHAVTVGLSVQEDNGGVRIVTSGNAMCGGCCTLHTCDGDDNTPAVYHREMKEAGGVGMEGLKAFLTLPH